MGTRVWFVLTSVQDPGKYKSGLNLLPSQVFFFIVTKEFCPSGRLTVRRSTLTRLPPGHNPIHHHCTCVCASVSITVRTSTLTFHSVSAKRRAVGRCLEGMPRENIGLLPSLHVPLYLCLSLSISDYLGISVIVPCRWPFVAC